MIDVQAIVATALASARAQAESVRLERMTLLSKLMVQRDELTTNVLKVTAQVADAESDIAAIDAAAIALVTPIVP